MTARGSNQYGSRPGSLSSVTSLRPQNSDLLNQIMLGGLPRPATASAKPVAYLAITQPDVDYIAGSLVRNADQWPAATPIADRLDGVVVANGVHFPDGQGAPRDEDGQPIVNLPILSRDEMDCLNALMEQDGSQEAVDIQGKLETAKRAARTP